MTDDSTPVISFSKDLDEWVSSDGTPVCQDHAHLQPCPFHQGVLA